MVLKFLGDILCQRDPKQSRRELKSAPTSAGEYLRRWKDHVEVLAKKLHRIRHLFFVGRGASLAAVGTGALIVKESDHFHAATHVTLPDRVRDGTFRRDLFHRLEVFTIAVPPLRDRPGDIAAIARFLLEGMEADVGRRTLTTGALARLAVESWPGNVRELRNALARAAALAPSETIDAAHVDLAVRPPRIGDSGIVEQALSPSVAKAMVREHRGNVSSAARAAGYARSTFRKLLKK